MTLKERFELEMKRKAERRKQKQTPIVTRKSLQGVSIPKGLKNIKLRTPVRSSAVKG